MGEMVPLICIFHNRFSACTFSSVCTKRTNVQTSITTSLRNCYMYWQRTGMKVLKMRWRFAISFSCTTLSLNSVWFSECLLQNCLSMQVDIHMILSIIYNTSHQNLSRFQYFVLFAMGLWNINYIYNFKYIISLVIF